MKRLLKMIVVLTICISMVIFPVDFGYADESTGIDLSLHIASSAEVTIDSGDLTEQEQPSVRLSGSAVEVEWVQTIQETSRSDEYKITAVTPGEAEVIFFNEETEEIYAKYTVVVTDHDYEITGVTEADCQSYSVTTYTCSVCGESYSKEGDELGDHSYGDWQTTQESTCTESGSKERVCSVCCETETEEIEALGHNIIKVEAKNPTELKEGNIEYWVCDRCGICFADENGEQEISADSVVIPKIEPEYTELSWSIEDGVLTVSGEGWMQDFDTASASPWYSQRDSITKIVVSEGLTHIGDRAFYQCSNVTEVEIASSVKSIGMWAFFSNSSLNEIVIPEFVEDLGSSSFRACSSLEKIIFEGNAPSLGTNVFLDTSGNLVIHFYENTICLDGDAWSGLTISVEHKYGGVEITKEPSCIEDGEQQAACLICGEMVIENIPALGHDYIDGYCTRCGDREILQSGSCGTSVKYIIYGDGEMVISGNGNTYSWSNYKRVPWYSLRESIKTVFIDSDVTSIGRCAFAGCTKLTGVYINNIAAWCRMTFIDVDSNPLQYAHHLYLNGEEVVDLKIPESITNINSFAFHGCGSLTSITIPDSVTSIGQYSFYGCSSLTSITIPDSVTSIGTSAFCDCCSLNSITIPESVTSIEDGAFSGCSSITNITIPEGIVNIGSWTFSGCSSITSFIIPESVTSIGDYAFRYCSSLTCMSIPEGVSSIGFSAFEGCNHLTTITIPFIGQSKTANTFLGYIFGASSSGKNSSYVPRSLKEVIIKGDLASIEEYAFSGCDNITRIVLPESNKNICRYAFYKCSNLSSLTIPEGVTSIGQYAFMGCNSLTVLSIPKSMTIIGAYTFCCCNGLANIIIPDSVTIIEDGAFHKCVNLKSITIPDSVTNIGQFSFYDCSRLTSIAIPDCVTNIGAGAFSGCSSLTNITIPDSVTIIEACTFEDCGNLTSITIPDSVTSIGASAFNGCNSITNIAIPESVMSIEGSAFRNCSKLTSITIPASVTSLEKNAISSSTKNIYVIKGSTADTVLKGDSRVKYVTKSGEHYVYETVKNKATLTANGAIGRKCTVCGKALSDKTIYYPKTVKLSATSYTYDGKVKKPTVSVKDSNGKTVASSNYAVTYASGRKNVGTYKVTIKFKGNYSGTKTLTFKINPKGTTLKTLTATSKGFKATWNKQATKMSTSYITGYQIQYSTSSTFASGNKTVTVSKYSTVSKTISKLKAKKKYYVRIRTYKTVSGTKYYSPWSAKKYVTTKA